MSEQQPIKRTSPLQVARQTLALRFPGAAIEPVDALMGIPGFLPFSVRPPDGSRQLWLAYVSSFPRVHLIRADDDTPAEVALQRLRTIYDVLIKPADLAGLDAGAVRSIRPLDVGFFLIEGDVMSVLVFAQWAPDGEVRQVLYGGGFGAVERRIAQTPLQCDELPVRDAIRVVNGGIGIEANGHYPDRSQRYGIDLEPLDPGASPDVFAPIGGTVVRAVDGVDDHPAFRHDVNGREMFGNHVVVRSDDGIEVALGHLRRGSVRVGLGARIRAGTRVGRLGNSGISSIPHLHVHAQQSAYPYHAVPMRFGSPDAPLELVHGFAGRPQQRSSHRVQE